MKSIIYYAPDDTIGDTSAEDCSKFRAWAAIELANEYPNHDVTVSAEKSTQTVYTNDIENESEIVNFASRLWDVADWAWI